MEWVEEVRVGLGERRRERRVEGSGFRGRFWVGSVRREHVSVLDPFHRKTQT